MLLRDYLDHYEVTVSGFADAIGISRDNVYKIMKKETDIHLSTALKIESFTGGKVKCKDLSPL